MAFSDDKPTYENLGGILPTRFGTPSGKANERTMIDSVGGTNGIRTKIRDGVLLKTGGGFARFVSLVSKETTAMMYRGFVLAGDVLSNLGADKPILMAFVEKVLSLWRMNYRINSGKEHVPYFVSSFGRGKAEFEANGTKVVAEDTYNDVYCIVGKTLYRNSLPYKTLPSGTAGVPYVRVEADPSVISVVTNTSTTLIASGAKVEEFSMSNFADPLAPGAVLSPGVLLDRVDNAARFCLMLYTSAGALQIWRASNLLASLSRNTTTDFEQIGVRGGTLLSGGWTSSANEPADGPWFSPPSSAYVLGGLYEAVSEGGKINRYLKSIVRSDNLVTPTNIYTYRFSRSNAASYTHQLYDGVSATTSVSVSAEAKYNPSIQVDYYGEWPLSDPLYVGQPYPESGYYIALNPAAFGAAPLNAGDRVGWLVTYSEFARDLKQTNQASIRVALDGMLNNLLEVDVFGTKNHTNGGCTTYALYDMNPGPLSGGNIGQDTFITVTKAESTFSAKTNSERTWSVEGVSRDYFFVDKKEVVSAWIEGRFLSSGNDASATTTITLKLVVQVKGSSYEEEIYSWSSPTGVNPNITSPDINFGTGVPWQYHAPVAPHPLYAPIWCDQGLCPHIAYTTSDEILAEQAYFFSFALRIQQMFPPVGYLPQPLEKGEFDALAPMFEWMVGYYGSVNIVSMWADLRERIHRISGSSKGDGDWPASVLGASSSGKVPYIFRT